MDYKPCFNKVLKKGFVNNFDSAFQDLKDFALPLGMQKADYRFPTSEDKYFFWCCLLNKFLVPGLDPLTR